jgi:hypothetical protein
MPDGIHLSFNVKADHVGELIKALKDMQAKQVLAGFPEEEAERTDPDGNAQPEAERTDPDGNAQPITNAALGYIHNFGAPEANIPARPFMVEGIESVRDQISDSMYAAGAAAFDGNAQRLDAGLNAVGLIAQNGIQGKIQDGPFEPLAPATLRARASRGRTGTVPLVDTGQMRNAVTYVIQES